ncbi:DUF2293 domain-containing protein [Aureimonas flava]|uniref:DUF2293 domain-containing protein n=1 Tax=Aureimonas flava TaxID=2320271 RepID=UPI001FDFA577|nr:DUF2293 domain-containing protein [Aureimonas flava]
MSANRSPPERLLLSADDQAAFLDQLGIYLAALYPRCPEAWRWRLVERARKRGHYGRLGEIAGILVDTSVRHEATDYDRLFKVNGRGGGLTREEARMVVAAEVQDTVEAWRLGSVETDASYAEMLRDIRRRRQKKGRRRNNFGVIGHESAAIADHLREWLARPSGGGSAGTVEDPTEGVNVDTEAPAACVERHAPAMGQVVD